MAGLFDDVLSDPPSKGGGLFDDVLATTKQEQPSKQTDNWQSMTFLPIARNMTTGEWGLGMPGAVKGAWEAAQAPGKAWSGELPMQEADPITGQVHTSMEGIKAGANVASLIPMAEFGRPATPAVADTTVQPAAPSLLTSEELKAAGAADMNAAKSSGATIPRSSFADTFNNMKQELVDKGFDDEPDLPLSDKMHRNAQIALRRFDQRMGMEPPSGNIKAIADNLRRTQGDEAANKFLSDAGAGGEPIDFNDIHKMRQLLKSVRSSQDPQERLFGLIMKDHLDEYVGNLAEDYPEAGQLQSGIEQYARASKAEMIEDLVQDAHDRMNQFTQSGLANAIQTNLRQFVRNDKKMRLFSPEEQASLRQASDGSFGLNVAKYFGKLAPRGVVSGAGDILIGHFLHNLVPVMGPIPTMVLGEVARRSADSMAERELLNVRDQVLAGGRSNLNSVIAAARPPSPPPQPSSFPRGVLATSPLVRPSSAPFLDTTNQ